MISPETVRETREQLACLSNTEICRLLNIGNTTLARWMKEGISKGKGSQADKFVALCNTINERGVSFVVQKRQLIRETKLTNVSMCVVMDYTIEPPARCTYGTLANLPVCLKHLAQIESGVRTIAYTGNLLSLGDIQPAQYYLSRPCIAIKGGGLMCYSKAAKGHFLCNYHLRQYQLRGEINISYNGIVYNITAKEESAWIRNLNTCDTQNTLG